MNRRNFLQAAAALTCLPRLFAQNQPVYIYDCYAMALYMDGSLGPRTGIITTEEMLAGAPQERQFWHGHGGHQHQFTITEGDFQKLAQGQRVYLTTTTVDRHQHRLFIDPRDRRYRVPGAEPVEATQAG